MFGVNFLTDAFQIILYEYIAYLADDDKRERAFVELKSQVGLKPHDIIRSDFDTLLSIAKLGGIHAEERARRIRLAAEMTIEDFNGDLQSVLNLPTQEARAFSRL